MRTKKKLCADPLFFIRAELFFFRLSELPPVLRRLDPFHLKSGKPWVFYVIHSYFVRGPHPLRGVIHIADLALARHIAFRLHGLPVLSGKTYRDLLMRRGTSAGVLLHVEDQIAPAELCHIVFCLVI